MADTIDRKIVANFTLPESALKAIRKAVAENVALGVQDGFKKSSGKKEKTEKPKEDAAKKVIEKDTLKNLNETTKSANSFAIALKGIGKAIGITAAALHSFMKMMEKVEEASVRMVTASSLFTDKGTMEMMQRTGQTAAQSTATTRSLDMLGISLSDIQSGYVTPAQMEMFEKLRAEHLRTIEESNAVSGSMFQKWQMLALTISSMTAGFGDKLIEILGRSGSVDALVTAVEPLINAIFQIIEILLPLIPMVLQVATAILPAIMAVMNNMVRILPVLIKIFQWLADVVTAILDPFVRFIKVIQGLFTWVTELLGIKAPAPSSNQPTSQNNYNGGNMQTTSYVNNYNQPSNNLFNNDYIGAN